jgi:hypothetical protein
LPYAKKQNKNIGVGGFCIKDKTSLFCFRQIMNGKFYVENLRAHMPQVKQLLGRRLRF